MKETRFYFTINGVRLPTKRVDELTMLEVNNLLKAIPQLKLNYELKEIN